MPFCLSCWSVYCMCGFSSVDTKATPMGRANATIYTCDVCKAELLQPLSGIFLYSNSGLVGGTAQPKYFSENNSERTYCLPCFSKRLEALGLGAGHQQTLRQKATEAVANTTSALDAICNVLDDKS